MVIVEAAAVVAVVIIGTQEDLPAEEEFRAQDNLQAKDGLQAQEDLPAEEEFRAQDDLHAKDGLQAQKDLPADEEFQAQDGLQAKDTLQAQECLEASLEAGRDNQFIEECKCPGMASWHSVRREDASTYCHRGVFADDIDIIDIIGNSPRAFPGHARLLVQDKRAKSNLAACCQPNWSR